MFLSKAVIFLISPLTLVLVLLCSALLCLFRGRKHLATFFISFSLIWLCFWSLPLTSHWLSLSIIKEYPYKAPASFANAEAIVVLGGGVKPANTLYPQPDIKNSGDRVWFASQLFHAGKSPLILLSGGVSPEASLYSEAEAMRIMMLSLGVPSGAMVLEGGSLNTSQNAELSAAILKKRGIRRVLLVTSVVHMRRAETEFRRRGLDVTAAATDYDLEPPTGLRPYLPEASALLQNTSAIKELVGRLVLRWK